MYRAYRLRFTNDNLINEQKRGELNRKFVENERLCIQVRESDTTLFLVCLSNFVPLLISCFVGALHLLALNLKPFYTSFIRLQMIFIKETVSIISGYPPLRTMPDLQPLRTMPDLQPLRTMPDLQPYTFNSFV